MASHHITNVDSQQKTLRKDIQDNKALGVSELLQEFVKAIRAGQIDEIMSFYAPEFTAFDMMPPLRFMDLDEYKEVAWQNCFADYFQFPVQYEQHEVEVYQGEEQAFCHQLLHMKAKSKKGEEMECWLRNTTGLQKIDGHWKIVHEHNSVPIDFDGKPLMNLKPGDRSHKSPDDMN